jgi:hypothetical protein
VIDNVVALGRWAIGLPQGMAVDCRASAVTTLWSVLGACHLTSKLSRSSTCRSCRAFKGKCRQDVSGT